MGEAAVLSKGVVAVDHASMAALRFGGLWDLMRLTAGRPDLKIALIDGPVLAEHSGLSGSNIRVIRGNGALPPADPYTAACLHGTFMAGMLCARRDSAVPGICPACTLLVRPNLRDPQASARRFHCEIRLNTRRTASGGCSIDFGVTRRCQTARL